MKRWRQPNPTLFHCEDAVESTKTNWCRKQSCNHHEDSLNSSVAQVVEGMSLRKQALHDTTKNILIKPNQLFFFYSAAKQRSYE